MHEKIFIVNADNISSQQLQYVTMELRGTFEIVLRKNIIMQFVINKDKALFKDILQLFLHLKSNVRFVSTNRTQLKTLLQKVQEPTELSKLVPISIKIKY